MMIGWRSCRPYRENRTVIKMSELIGAKDGDNPHIWHNPVTMSALVAKLAEVLNKPDAVAAFTQQMQSIAKASGVPIVGVSEAQPPSAASCVEWMLSQLRQLVAVLPQ